MALKREAVALASGCALVAAVYWLRRRRRAALPPIDVGPPAKAVAPAAADVGGAKLNVLKVQQLAKRWGRKKKVDLEETPFHHAITELRELGATLADKKNVEGAEAIERAVSLLSTLRLSSHGSSHESHRKSFNQLIDQIQESNAGTARKGEALGLRQWVRRARAETARRRACRAAPQRRSDARREARAPSNGRSPSRLTAPAA